MGDEHTRIGHGIASNAVSPLLAAHKAELMASPEMSETPLQTAHDIASNGGPQMQKETRRRRGPYSKTTVVKLVSTNATSSAFPESFGLGVSVTGRWLSAFSSSALYLISTAHLPDYRDSCRAFRIRRKPLAVAITDSGRFAVLTTPHKVDIYECGNGQGNLLVGTCKKLETIHLDNEAKTLAFSKCGEVVAAGSDVGLEIKNLSPGSLEVEKRHITCSAADRLMFSRDGRSLLATSVGKKSRYSTFISVSEAFGDTFGEEEIEQQPLGKVWITQLLFPERVAARPAVLLPSSGGDLANNEILAFDPQWDRFRVWDIPTKKFSNKMLGLPEEVDWSRHHKLEDALPAISASATSVAFALRTKTDKQIWTYAVPPQWWDFDASISLDSESSHGGNNSLPPDGIIHLPAVEEHAPSENITRLKWVENDSLRVDRLVALVSAANIAMPEEAVPTEPPAASGKVLLIDFQDNEHPNVGGEAAVVTLDLGDIAINEGLTDEELTIDREVDLIRRRTQVQRNRPPVNPVQSPRGSLRRSVSSGSTSGGIPTLRNLQHSNSGRSSRRRRSFSSLSTNEERDEVVPIDEPYSQQQPRSQFSLNRAATIAAVAPSARLHLRALPDRPLEYRRADGTREIPHESDADNWVPPPPPYTERPDNTVSHPIGTSTVASNAPQQNTQSRSVQPARQQRQNIPPVPHIPRAYRDQQAANPIPVLPQHSGLAPGPIPSSGQARPSPHHLHTGSHSSTLTNGSAFSQSSQRPAGGEPIFHGSPSHRNAESSSTVSGRVNHHAFPLDPVPQQMEANFSYMRSNPQQQPESHPTMASLPAMDVMSHGLPPNMTPPSPIAEFIRPAAVRTDTPTPRSSIAEQNRSLHRHSGSTSSSSTPNRGASLAPAISAGSLPANNFLPQHLASAELMRNSLPPVPAIGNQHSPRGSLDSPNNRPSSRSSGTRRYQRPILNRLATIASVAEHQPHTDEFAIQPVVQSASAQTTPESPVTRRQWWRSGNSTPRSGRENVAVRAATAPLQGSVYQQQQQQQGGTRYAATAPASAVKRGREKDRDGGMKCVVM